MKVIRKIIEIDPDRCDGCGQCVISCAEGAIEIIDGKATLVSEAYCDGLGACLGECPQGALKLVEREAEDFDPEAVEHYLEHKHAGQAAKARTFHAVPQCPSHQIHMLKKEPAPFHNPNPASTASALSHWPVQIRLIPPDAPFLQEANLLVAADCTAVAVPNFHEKFLNGRVVMIGCPKFDNIMDYAERFAKIFAHNAIRRVTVLSMEVPCCSALLGVVRKGMENAGKKVPLEEVVVGIQGDVLETRTIIPDNSPQTSSNQD
ncbi:ATP-binding protein [Desulfosoma caldarium]|uniref:4Fe-4S binding protein n=1 Tax=Desulfosoma caldarium TaxID=610254 RepID=A0A3N1UZW5_9BACT|nr:4Fe-4S binding protein [Desulfosoma caldarium]ROQ93401.1 4Fe-4S binding protein [Desulfosoma caldarium]